jgi:hypothetical protein
MGKVLSILIGLILIALGVWGLTADAWRAATWTFIQGGLVIMAIIIGLGIFVFGLSELRAGPEEPAVIEPTPAPEQPTQEAPSQSTQGEQ